MIVELPPPAIDLTVFGVPAPKGSKSAFPIHGKGGKTRVVVTEGKQGSGIKVWKERLASTIQGAAEAGTPMLDGPVVASIDFYLPRPKSAPKTRRTWPDRKPDIDKLLRAVLDALTGVLLADDARVVELQTSKRFAGDDELQGRPRAEIRIWELVEMYRLRPEQHPFEPGGPTADRCARCWQKEDGHFVARPVAIGLPRDAKGVSGG